MLKYNIFNNFMTLSALQAHLDIEDMAGNETLGLIVFKPGYLESEVSEFKRHCDQNGLSIINNKELVFSREAVIALYPQIFSFSREDLEFGVNWKQRTIDYLISGPSLCFLVRGEFASDKLSKYKYGLREKYKKITHPKNKLSEADFLERVIKNLVHVVDQQELQNCIWLIFKSEIS